MLKGCSIRKIENHCSKWLIKYVLLSHSFPQACMPWTLLMEPFEAWIESALPPRWMACFCLPLGYFYDLRCLDQTTGRGRRTELSFPVLVNEEAVCSLHSNPTTLLCIVRESQGSSRCVHSEKELPLDYTSAMTFFRREGPRTAGVTIRP